MSCRALRSFLAIIETTPRHERFDLIQAAVIAGDGNWNVENVEPDPLAPQPALYEISLHGIWASGLSLEEAVNSWLRQARYFDTAVAA